MNEDNKNIIFGILLCLLFAAAVVGIFYVIDVDHKVNADLIIIAEIQDVGFLVEDGLGRQKIARWAEESNG